MNDILLQGHRGRQGRELGGREGRKRGREEGGRGREIICSFKVDSHEVAKDW